jgi:Type VI secretion system effector, Hcp/PEP-CTERM motif
MKRSYLTLCIAVVAFALVAGNTAYANTVHDINLPGIGNQIPILSFSFGPGNTLTFTKEIDVFSPLLFNAVVLGTAFSTGSLDTYDTSVSTTVPITSFGMTNILLTSIQTSGGTDIPFETVSLQYETGAFVNTTVPEPSSLILLAGGLAGFSRLRRRKLVRN